jgi:hypothetical protein
MRKLGLVVAGVVMLACAGAFAQAPAQWSQFERLATGSKADKLDEFLDTNPNFDVNYPHSPSTKQTTVFFLAYSGKAAFVKVLTEHGLNLGYTDAAGATALVTAIRSPKTKESLEVVKVLLDAGADINQPQGGATPYMIAAIYGRIDAMELLASRGADPKAIGPGGSSALDTLDWSYSASALKGKKAAYEKARAHLVTLGVTNILPYTGDSAAALAVTAAGKAENTEKIDASIDRFIGAFIDRPKGTGRLCNHRLLIGNLTGAALDVELKGRLESGKLADMRADKGGRFSTAVNSSTVQNVWLDQGGSFAMGVQGNKAGRSYAGMIQFDVPETCDDKDSGVTVRRFIVELDNSKDQLTIFEDKDGDLKPDVVAVAAGAASAGAANVCASLIPLATEIAPDNSRLMFDDAQLDQMLSSAGCTLPERIADQRQRLSGILTKP